MNLSFGEYRALVAKALRGGGYSWGLAEDGAFAAARLAEFGISSAEMVVKLLYRVDGHDQANLMPSDGWRSSSGELCPIALGASLADIGGCEDELFEAVNQPVLLAPILSQSCSADRGYSLRWEGGECHLDRHNVTFQGRMSDEPCDVTIGSIAPPDGPGARSARVVLASAMVGELSCFAHRTYAPATEASRLAGAGAGTHDND